MTRRKFIQQFFATAAAVITGTWCLAKKTPRKFVRAVRLKNYPGPLKTLKNISKQGNWSG